ncbi:ribonuclease R [Pontibacter sp. G13]|uniref:ribonuclease R n=1 Tax=Pontibacter sp. G13 TaxID=3074898 RepID=UPI002889DEF7|nr:ribonuclease R [Pontibacter sp. G13]WNJ18947.1 ribonuclease R [Pontibacter sp. G13]
MTKKKKTADKSSSVKKKRLARGQKVNAKKKKKQIGNRQNSLQKLLLHEILTYMRAHRNKQFTCKQVGAATGLFNQVGNTKIRSIMDQLAEEGRLAYSGKGRYQYQSRLETRTGKIQITRSGVGFLLQDEGEDVFIGPRRLGKAMDGDMVKVKMISRRSREGRQEGEVVEVVQRARTQFVGTVEEGLPGTYYLIPDDFRVKTEFLIKDTGQQKIIPGHKALVKLLDWKRQIPVVELLSLLGEAGEHETEMHAILLQYGFDPNFPMEVEHEADNIAEKIPAAEIKARRDMREVTTFTIDPVDAKDFDDALSFRVLENGHYEVGVHIADVSHYVVPGTELDKEAFQRATSVYLVDRTIPMLPEKLSNVVCSLRPHEDKLTYSAVFEMNDEAKVIDYWIGRTVIHSDHRFAYEDAQAVIEGESEGPYKEEILTLDALAKKLRGSRMKKGSIEFDSNEVKFVLDENDKPVRVVKKEMKDANKLIEDFMLLANRTVSAHIYNLKDNPPLHSVYRVHDVPDLEKLGGLAKLASHFGHEVKFEQGGKTTQMLNKLLTEARGKPQQNVIETVAVRSMAKAIYTINNIGHFGLGFEYYTHFTSPIRRYPDLMVHRLLTNYHNKIYRENPNVLETQLKHCSDRERTAAEAERASVKYKQVEFLEDKIGEEFTGVISGVIESGMFVELKDNLCEGFAPIHSMEDDFYHYNQDLYCFVGEDHGVTYRLGDEVTARIVGTNLERKQVEMAILPKPKA